MSWDFCNFSEPTARKNHICECCGMRIPPGFKYFRMDGKCDGDMCTVKCHVECEKKFQEVSCDHLRPDDEVFYCDFYEYFHDKGESIEAHKELIKEKYGLTLKSILNEMEASDAIL